MMNDFLATLHSNWDRLVGAFGAHVQIALTAVAFGAMIAVPLGIALTRYPKIGQKVIAVLSILQTIPSMVMFGILLPFTGIGRPTAIIALTLYSILPILRNTYTGISDVSDSYIDAGKGMGMNGRQILFRVELPIALPVIVTGIRISSVYIISWATVATIVGGGGLGDIIFIGVARHNHAMILMGAIPASLLAITTSFIVGRIAKAVTPRGLRRERAR
ncbi:MAG: ABC transporter permease [Oscillospiraceae bacterium]|nr:ABC transporter permease [Oscillospiraceae bacterium]